MSGQDEFSVQIGDNLVVPFFDMFVFLSSYKDRQNGVNAFGPYWARIVGSTPTHIIINFLGYPEDFNVFIHRDDLPQLVYKFQLQGSDIYELMEINKKAYAELTGDDTYEGHNNALYDSHLSSGHQELLNTFGIPFATVVKMNSYDEWNCPVGPSKGNDEYLFFYQDLSQFFDYAPPVEIVGRWKSVDMKSDGDCMYRAIASGLNYLLSDGDEEWGYDNADQDELQAQLRQQAVDWLCDPNNQNINFGGMNVRGHIIAEAKRSGYIKGKKAKESDAAYEQRAIQAYCQKQRQRGKWGTSLESFALANIYSVAINVYFKLPGETKEQSYDRLKERITPENEEDIDGEINIYYINGNHYRAMYPNMEGLDQNDVDQEIEEAQLEAALQESLKQ